MSDQLPGSRQEHERAGGTRRRVTPLVSAGGLVLAAIVAVIVYSLLPGTRDAVRSAAPRGGVVDEVKPWVDRAETALRQMMDGGSGVVVAGAIQGIAHPSGVNAQLRKYVIRRMGGTMSVRISTNWRGGILGTSYTTDVVWEFDEMRHISAAIISDDAIVGVASKNAWELDDYFRREFYPVLRSNAEQ